jgi:hypothetical protein
MAADLLLWAFGENPLSGPLATEILAAPDCRSPRPRAGRWPPWRRAGARPSPRPGAWPISSAWPGGATRKSWPPSWPPRWTRTRPDCSGATRPWGWPCTAGKTSWRKALSAQPCPACGTCPAWPRPPGCSRPSPRSCAGIWTSAWTSWWATPRPCSRRLARPARPRAPDWPCSPPGRTPPRSGCCASAWPPRPGRPRWRAWPPMPPAACATAAPRLPARR